MPFYLPYFMGLKKKVENNVDFFGTFEFRFTWKIRDLETFTAVSRV